GTRLCVPNNATLREALLTEAHSSPFSVHPGWRRFFNKRSYDYTALHQRLYQTETHVSHLVFGKVCRKLGEPGLSSVPPFILRQTVGERVIEGPKMIKVTNKKVVIAKQKLKEARTRQKSYADKHHRSLEFQPGDHVFLKVSPARGVRRFGIKGKLSPRFIGPFEILDRVGEVSYRLALPPQLSHVHNVGERVIEGLKMIEVTNEKVVIAKEKLKEARTHQKSYADKHRYRYHPLHVASYSLDQIRVDLSYVEEPEAILDRQDRVMRNKTIPFVKILWRNHPEQEAIWETEESIRISYPHFLP
nr:putative reverse transcriptase domain-containing protein [Tanacetum cinerariifolium]